MQRVRIGLTGLACVFVLVLLAAAFFGLVRPEDEPAGARDGATNAALANQAEESPKEPLAELGVTPGGGKASSEPKAAPKP